MDILHPAHPRNVHDIGHIMDITSIHTHGHRRMSPDGTQLFEVVDQVPICTFASQPIVVFLEAIDADLDVKPVQWKQSNFFYVAR